MNKDSNSLNRISNNKNSKTKARFFQHNKSSSTKVKNPKSNLENTNKVNISGKKSINYNEIKKLSSILNIELKEEYIETILKEIKESYNTILLKTVKSTTTTSVPEEKELKLKLLEFLEIISSLLNTKQENLLLFTKSSTERKEINDFYLSILNHYFTPLERMNKVIQRAIEEINEKEDENKELVEELKWTKEVLKEKNLSGFNLNCYYNKELKNDMLSKFSKTNGTNLEFLQWLSEYSEAQSSIKNMEDLEVLSLKHQLSCNSSKQSSSLLESRRSSQISSASINDFSFVSSLNLRLKNKNLAKRGSILQNIETIQLEELNESGYADNSDDNKTSNGNDDNINTSIKDSNIVKEMNSKVVSDKSSNSLAEIKLTNNYLKEKSSKILQTTTNVVISEFGANSNDSSFNRIGEISNKTIDLINQNNNELLSSYNEKQLKIIKQHLLLATSEDFNLIEYFKTVNNENTSISLLFQFILNYYGLIDYSKELINSNKTSISFKKINDMIPDIASGYLKNPYHNSLHALDVTQTCFNIGVKNEIHKELSDLDLTALFVSCVFHDIGHNGYTNNYHINTMSELALTYNDKSVLENYHISVSWKLILKHKILENFSNEEKRIFRKRLVEAILSTDMTVHSQVISSFRLLVDNSIENEKLNRDKNQSLLSNALFTEDKQKRFNNEQTLINFIVHCSDTSNPTKPFEISKYWAVCVLKEFFNQGDEERKQKLSISFLCDRNTVQCNQSQIGFSANIVLPMFKILTSINSKNKIYEIRTEENIEKWKNEQDILPLVQA